MGKLKVPVVLKRAGQQGETNQLINLSSGMQALSVVWRARVFNHTGETNRREPRPCGALISAMQMSHILSFSPRGLLGYPMAPQGPRQHLQVGQGGGEGP